MSEEDLSPRDFKFDLGYGLSLRDRARDILDLLARRPYYKIRYGRKFSFLSSHLCLVLPEKGMSTRARRQWANQHLPFQNARILVVGCGSAWDFGSYLQFKPAELVGVDLFNFRKSWEMVSDAVSLERLPTKVRFLRTDISELNSLFPEGYFDVISSDAVFEHCQDLRSVMAALNQVLKPGGLIYASYGPLWYCFGGDHFSGRGGIENGYNHLISSEIEYRQYYQAFLTDSEMEIQNGGRYIPLSLFSKLSTKEYLEVYRDSGFEVESLVVELSLMAEKYQNSADGAAMVDRVLKCYTNIGHDDLSLKSHLVLLRKK